MSKRLQELLNGKNLRGYQVGRLIVEDFLERLQGGSGILADSDVKALRRALPYPQEESVVLAHGNVCMHAFYWFQDAELEAVKAEREIYRGIIQLFALVGMHGKQEPPGGVAACLHTLMLCVRFPLILWMARKAAVEVASEYLQVDLVSLFTADEEAIRRTVAKFNEYLEKGLLLFEVEMGETEIHLIDMAKLKPTDCWRGELAEEMRENPHAERFEMADRLQIVAAGLPEGEWSISR